MKRYLVFAGNKESQGGMKDFMGDYEIEDAGISWAGHYASEASHDWAHVWDCDTMRIVWEG